MNSRKSNYCFSTSLHKWMKISLLSSLLITGFVARSIAQEPRKTQNITGNVTNSEKSPLVGASVKIKNRTTGTTTDENGNFSINAALTDTLIVTYINYMTQTVRINNRTSIPIIMVDAANNMNEVIVIGYGSLKRKELTGVVGKVNMVDLRKAPVTSFDQALAGRIAGVTVSTNDGQPGAGSQISIRGTSAGQDVSPLYVVDGFPIENMDINSINTNDIESIDVLKDASSIAIYGSRGANGVIIITTKKGKAQPTRITYTVSDGIQTQTKLMKLLSPYEFVKLQLEIDSAYGNTTPIGRRRYIDTANGIDLNYYKKVQGYDWQKMLLQTGLLQIHNLNIIGGNNDLRYAINGSYTNQKGIIVNTGLKKYDGKFSLDNKFNDKIKYGFSLNYSNTTSFGTVPTSGTSGGVVSNMWAFRPVDIIGGVFLDAQLIDSSQLNGSSFTPDNLVNPYQQATNEYRKNLTKTTTLNSYLEYKINQDLQVRFTAGTSNTALIAETFYNTKTKEGLLVTNTNGTLYNVNGINGSVNNINNSTYLLNALLSYRKVKDRAHILDAVMGVDYSYGKAAGNGFTSILIPQEVEGLGVNSIGYGTVSKFGYGPTQNQLYSVLGRINYSLLERYIFTLTGREDGSSKFAPEKQWGFFPSGAFAWHFTHENFMQHGIMRKVSSSTRFYDGKLRISYGFVGNNRVGDFSYLYQTATTTGAGYPVNNINMPGAIPYFIGNPSLTWETTGQLDIGTTLSFLGDKILIDMDYYNKRTTNSLLAVPVSKISGYNVGNALQYQNAGVIRNRGFEFTLTTTNIQKRKFTWITSFNIAFNRNKIISFYNGDTKLTPTSWVAKVGYPISQFFGYKWVGVYQYKDFNRLANGTYELKNGIPTYGNNAVVQPGDPKYADLNGDGVVNESDRTIIGSPLPIHTGGLSNNFKYGNFDLGVFFQWSYGNQVLNQNKLVFDYSGNYYTNSNQFADYVNRWTPTNPTNDIPRATNKTSGQDPDGITRESSRLIEDASYLRFKTISLSYNVPAKIINKYKLTTLSFNVSVQNIFTITKYSGQDPEVSTYRAANPSNVPSGITGGNATGGAGYSYVQPSSGTPALAQGYDLTAYPRGRTYVIGASITF